MEAPETGTTVVERFLASLTRRWPDDAEIDAMLDPGVRFVERPSMVDPVGGERDLAQMKAGIAAGRALLAWQEYAVQDHVVSGDTVVTRFRWSGELAADTGPWAAGTRLDAWCVAHYVVRDGRIVHIEQHDCFEQPVPPGAA